MKQCMFKLHNHKTVQSFQEFSSCSVWCVSGGQGRVRASVIVHMDPHIKRVPAALITFVLKVMSPFLFNTIQKILKTEFDSPEKVLPTRMRQKPELYGLIAPRIDEYIHHLQGDILS